MEPAANPQAPDLTRVCTDQAAIEAVLAAMRARIRDRRAARGWTQKQLGDRAGCWQTYIGQIERGRKTPPLPTLLALAQALEVDVRELLAPPPGASVPPEVSQADAA
ncbi:hypothetical protein CKO31_18205 [Thiohalocapsa halophila]|uniref:HTH cro/C1-type domain-containing protein n=1 Tax=Thiohalocapsa halophila TaxID=69359 RepID=A0ABS1CLD0_9GAMM|nr:helix-turn-helix transcriptional regulator [Thiohalocapsa halophila]MBK1632639.1 hypothetical protein [Thiohalocapsa halophila]